MNAPPLYLEKLSSARTTALFGALALICME